ncbi:MAG: YdcF family protein [Candidatus Nomurabacteria bacterium]|nr:MAG: YdcF family protein [Candidatus Nomurabacteria bacterium]
MICLGCGLSPDGTQASRQSASIARKGLNLYQAELARCIVLSGGNGNDGHMTEAIAMKRLIEARARNVYMILENGSIGTINNAIEVLRITRQHPEWRSVALVTHPWHARRARAIFRYVWHGSGIEIIVIKARSSYGGNCQKRFRHFLSFLVWDLLGWSAFLVRRFS